MTSRSPHEHVDYDEAQHEVYEQGRRLASGTSQLWVERLVRHGPRHGVRRLLDIGAGTGRFADLFAEALDVDVIGVEPSTRMRNIARREHDHPRVRYLAGSAEALPLASASVEVAWLSMVLHHIRDLDACAQELRRVVKPGGRVLLRSSFAGRLDSARFYAFFPGALAADEQRLPGLAAVQRTFEAHGFAFQALDVVHQLLDPTWNAYVERIGHRALSSFEYISDAAFEAGLAAMRAAGDAGEEEPVYEDIDLLVFERP
ncbi:MAG: class I SAM-dependent methyltransferase [Planctomycetota bacterium]|nr:class I SAM-dependent methyltransferase [Planctomycetota bacterium]